MTNPPYGPPGQPPQGPAWGGQQPQGPGWGGQPQPQPQQPPAGWGPQQNPGWQGGGPQPAAGPQWGPGPTPPAPAPAGRKNRNMLLIGGVVIALLIGILAYVVINRNSGQDTPTGPGSSPTTTTTEPGPDGAAASEEVMTSLLTALSEGRAADAMALIDTSGIVLAESEPLLADGALTGNVGNVSFLPELQLTQQGQRYSYTTELTVAGETRSITWDVNQAASGEWLADGADVLGTLMLAADAHVLVNGILVAPEVQQLKALPGSYHFTSNMPLLYFPEEQSYKTLFGGGAATFSSTLLVAPGVQDAVIAQIRAVIDACAASPEMPGTCHWELRLTNGDVSSGTVSWRLDPADPAATIVMPTVWQATSGYRAVVTLAYTTIASGDCWLWAGGGCYFVDAINDRRTRFEIDLSGAEAAVWIL